MVWAFDPSGAALAGLSREQPRARSGRSKERSIKRAMV
jgi:hypothetical protein